MTSLVSVVIPVYNVENYIERTLKSVINQTYKNLEIVLVNDGSRDNSVIVAERYLKNINCNWRFIHQHNQGLSAARNRGISEANGEWVICPDSDDYLAPQAIEEMLKAANKFSVDAVFCGFKYVKENAVDNKLIKCGTERLFNSNKMRDLFLKRRIILLVPGMLLKKSIYKDIQFDPDCPYDEDIHFLWRLLFYTNNIVYLDSNFYNYVMRKNSMVHTLKSENFTKTAKIYEKLENTLKDNYPNEDSFIKCIYPKYRLGGLHVLAKSVDFVDFKNTVLENHYRTGMINLIKYGDFKLKLLTLIYCFSIKIFYLICKRV